MTGGQAHRDGAHGHPEDVLVAHGLQKAYGRTAALRDVSFSVAAGEVVAITGPSGSGKSTLLHCLCGILTPDAGEVRYAGERLDTRSDARRSELRRTAFGILFQFGQLVPELTAAENVALPLLLGGTRRRAALAAAKAALDGLAIGDLAPMRPGEMSGGQGQRVALARALVTTPRVLFADEPTGALDSLSGEQVLAGLVRLAREQGTAVVIVTHDAKVAAYADREVAMRDGTIDPPDGAFTVVSVAGRDLAGAAR
jgi:putative ABC transport system ATP-binding protein